MYSFVFTLLCLLFCVFGGGIHGKFMKMGLCCFCWVFESGIRFSSLSSFVGFLIRSIFEELVKCFFFLINSFNL